MAKTTKRKTGRRQSLWDRLERFFLSLITLGHHFPGTGGRPRPTPTPTMPEWLPAYGAPGPSRPRTAVQRGIEQRSRSVARRLQEIESESPFEEPSIVPRTRPEGGRYTP